MARRLLGSLLILSMFIITITWVPSIAPHDSDTLRNEIDSPLSDSFKDDRLIQLEEENTERNNFYYVSEAGPNDGILNPATIEQVGYTSSGIINGRTDSGINTAYPLPLDDMHGWKGSQANLSISKLTKLYVLNGSFTYGTGSGDTFYPNATAEYYPYGWNAVSTNGNLDQVQRVSYEKSDPGYIVVETKAKLTNNPQHQYTHYTGTTVYWNQSIDISPATSDFVLSFDYLYQYGPIDGTGPDTVPGNAYIEVLVDGTVIYSISLKNLVQRSKWFNTGQIPISFTPSQNPTMFMIGIHVNNTFMLDADYDYDYIPGADGASNSEYITVYFDDVSFTAATPPSFEQVDLQFNVEGSFTPVVGSSGIGFASISNSDYWTASPVDIQVISNTTVSFEYEAVLKTHRFSNSTWMTDNTKIGVQYTVAAGNSPQLSFYTYIGFIGGYINLTTHAWFPSDWENVTVFDPFLVDVTSSCNIASNMVEIPTVLMGRLGWWKFNLESPNYAKNIEIQNFDFIGEAWNTESEFRSGNRTRAIISIGTITETPALLDEVIVIWYLPNGSIWTLDTMLNGVGGLVISTPHGFGSVNTSAGQWSVYAEWNNGTEVAYGKSIFSLYHSALLIAEPTEITTNVGSIIKGIVRYTDGDTGAYLMDTPATILGNWSASTIPFVAISVRNWWEADFDTSLVGAGKFTIVVTASKPYYDPASCIISVHAINLTRLTSPNAPWTASKLGSQVDLTFRYESYHSLTDTWSHVKNESDVIVAINWTMGYWSVEENIASGFYLMTLDTNIVDSGTYLLNVTFSKPNHELKTLFLTLILSPMTSSLVIYDGLSDTVDLEAPRPIKLGFMDKNGFPVQNANITIDSVSPSSGLSHTSVDEVPGETGNYSTTLTAYSATVFTIRFLATGKNVEPAISVFVIVVNDVSTVLEIFGSSNVEIGFSDTYNTTFRYRLENGTGIETAQISIVYSGPTKTLTIQPLVSSSGNYSYEFSARLPGTYIITIIAYKPFHQRQSSSFALTIGNVPANLLLSTEGSMEMGVTDSYEMGVRYEMYNGTGIESAAISVIHSSSITSRVTDLGLGNYSIQFNATLPGGYLVTITASRQYYQDASTSFLLVVREFSTNLILSVEGFDVMSLTDTYEMNFRYQFDNGTGIDDAEINIIYSSDLHANYTPLGLGNYILQINATKSGPYLITIDASKQYCQRISASFLLTVRNINTTLASMNGTGAFVSFGKNYTLFVSYTNSSGHGLVGAYVSVESADPGIIPSPTQDEGSGIYSILLTPLSSNTFTIIVQATLENHLPGVVYFALTVTPIPTTLTTLDLSTSISVDQNFTVHLQFQDEDMNTLSGASLSILNPPPELENTSFEEVGGGIYQVTLTPTSIGTYDIVFSASKAGYQTDYAGFILSATIIQTQLVVSGLTADSIKFGETYDILVLYKRTDNGKNVTDAIISVETQRSGLIWSSSEEVEGGYRITLDSQRAYNWTIEILAVKDNHAPSSVQFQLRVERVLISVGFVTDLSAMEGSTFPITVRLTESGTTNPIDDARVLYRFSVSRTGLFQEMNATGTPGEYTVSLSVPLYANSPYRLEINVEKENYVLLEPIDISFTITQSPERLYPIIAGSSGIGIFLVVFFMALRIYSARKKKQLSFDMVNKRRFDDADNLIGVIVLHKKSGIPIYSRIPKGGFDEGIVAAFVSAVTHFREEFEMFDEEQMQVIPISDIIRAVQTRNLICAFITVKSASIEQNRKMEAYAMQVGTYLDDLFDERPSSLIDEKINEMLDYIFDTTMDGHLLKFYKMSTDRGFPKRYQFLAELMESLETRHCSKPVYLAQGVATYGVSQARGCTLVLEAIDKGLIHICDEHEVTTPEIEFKDYFNRSQNRKSGAEA